MALPPLSHPRDLTDEQWALIGPFLPTLARRKDRRGRPWKENRTVLNGILWILEDRGPVGGPPGPLSVVSNLPPAISALGPRRPASEPPRNSRAGAPRRRPS